MGNTIWLASYPKSGNTWLRVFLANIFSTEKSDISINELPQDPIAACEETFSEYLGYDSSDLSQIEIDRLRPLVDEYLAATSKTVLYRKIHDAYRYINASWNNGSKTPLVSTTATRGVIYILRDPLDVCVSYAHHNDHQDYDRVIAKMAANNASLAGRTGEQPGQLKQMLLSWSEHVLSWVDNKEIPVHVVKYEDMLNDPLMTFSEILRFCRLHYSTGDIEAAIESSRFDRLRDQELRDGFSENQKNNYLFFRQGKQGGWRKVLSNTQVMRLQHDHYHVMKRYGYINF